MVLCINPDKTFLNILTGARCQDIGTTDSAPRKIKAKLYMYIWMREYTTINYVLMETDLHARAVTASFTIIPSTQNPFPYIFY